ncbi:MAG: hypothetical protein NW226_12335 [Microscillaceae bacterium]|nr:hypothetical protein [Microscillaceae bacterium]
MIPISYEIADKVIEIRAILKGKLPDLIVGVSALMSGCDLITHNVGDFQHISPSLKIIDPFQKYKVV